MQLNQLIIGKQYRVSYQSGGRAFKTASSLCNHDAIYIGVSVAGYKEVCILQLQDKTYIVVPKSAIICPS